MGEIGTKTPDQSRVSEAKTRVLERLEEQRRALFEEDYVPPGIDLAKPFYAGLLKDGTIDRISERQRALLWFNKLVQYLPGGSLYDNEVCLERWGNRSPKDFARDFAEAAAAYGIDPAEVERMNDPLLHGASPGPGSTDSVLELFQYVYPAVEDLIKDKDYPVPF